MITEKAFALCRSGKLKEVKYGVYFVDPNQISRDLLHNKTFFNFGKTKSGNFKVLMPNYFPGKLIDTKILAPEDAAKFDPERRSLLLAKIINFYFTQRYGKPAGSNQFIIQRQENDDLLLHRSVQYTVDVNKDLEFSITPVLRHSCFIPYKNFLQFEQIFHQVKKYKGDRFLNAKIILHDKSFLHKTVILVSDKNYFKKCSAFINKFHLGWISPDTEVLATFGNALFMQFHNYSNLNTDTSVKILGRFLKTLPPMEDIEWEPLPYIPFQPFKANLVYSLLLGKNKVAGKLAAVFYNGLYKPIPHFKLNLILIDHDRSVANMAVDILIKFTGINKDQVKIYYFESKNIKQTLAQLGRSNQTLCICRSYVDSYTKNQILNKTKFRYLGFLNHEKPDNAIMANFIAKMCTQFGGVIAGIKNKPFWTLSMDIGHNSTSLYSILTMVVHGSDGTKYKQYQYRTPLKENLEYETFYAALESIRNYLELHNFPFTGHCLVLRDGKMHHKDTQHIVTSFNVLFPEQNLSVLSVRKSGSPYLFVMDSSKYYKNAEVGQYFLQSDPPEAWLLTNEQAVESNQPAIPLGLKLEYGNTDQFKEFIEYIYWQCRLFQNSLYYCNRLPAGIALADALSYTGERWQQ